ncbi:hypothetical protein FVP74_11995 [Microbacterium saccharophilum]|uniref:Leucine rich repeat variant domain-containing protein n=1 Tax=Microbacterium saccharophilum TaxID=1213358 RepID=A0A5C8HU81_9MICO|nr:hypothetical protein [Microbacterium saccharophilum]TXK08811.1 hypothetical protein FVP74_11995 [Microbacterium saccharophilum]GEP49186.1 hypothetical protein MSA03_26940 [Microbacterium saccharophilum]
MSLTGQLRDPGSPIREYLERISPRVASSAQKQDAADPLGFADLAQSRLLVPRPKGVDGSLVGMAFDYRARIELGGFDALTSTAAAGVSRADEYRGLVDNADHRLAVLQGTFEAAVELLRSESQLDFDRASVLLAHCERVVRVGSRALSGSTGAELDAAADGWDFADNIDRPLLDDVGALLGASRPQLASWKEEITDGQPYEPNPHFVGASLVGGADGDWLIGETLIDSKVYSHLNVSSLRAHIIQLLGYVMLDLDDALGIRRVAVWLPRQQVLATWSLTRLLGGDPEELLPTLREGFVKATGRRQLARHEPVPQRRRHQMLADNRHTPYVTLEELALSNDADIRRRVGRNSVAPEAAVRLLAHDRSWSVREGVAMNEAAPDDVLQTLSTDRSKAVRLAVAANPGAPRAAVSALTTDIDPNVRWSARTNDGEVTHAPGALAIPESSATTSGIVAATNRDSAAWNSRVVERLVHVMLDSGPWPGWRLPIPDESFNSAIREGQDVRAPDWLRAGIPRQVAEDLRRADRPEWLRWRVSWALPIDDPVVRADLLADSNPDIRWWALQQTTSIDAPDLSEKLLELASSKPARVAFRRAGLDHRYEAKTSREYDAEVLEVVAAHRSSPPQLLAELSAATSTSIRLRLVDNPALPNADRAAIVETLLTARSSEARVALARIGVLSSEIIKRLEADRDSYVREAVAGREDLTDETINALAVDREWTVRLALLQNAFVAERAPSNFIVEVLRNAPEASVPDVLEIIEELHEADEFDTAIVDALERLSKSRVRAPDLRRTAARHARTGPRTLERLARSTDAQLREDVAGNSNTPPTALEKLSRDEAADVRAAVAHNASTTKAVLTDLSHDGDPKVRAALTRLSQLELGALARLLEDEDAGVRRAAQRHPSAEEAARCHGQPSDSGNELTRATEPEPVDRQVFEAMAGDKRAEVRMRAAYDPRTPPDILEFLGGERRSSRVRRAVAANPNAPARLLRLLSADEDEQVRQAVAFNGATKPDVLVDLAGRSIDLALIVALNPAAPDDVLAALSADPEPLVRHVAAGMRLGRRISPDSRPQHSVNAASDS